MGSDLTTPLYEAYRQRWGLGDGAMAAMFAIYVASLLGFLLACGTVSDRVGRRKVLLAGLLCSAAGSALFAIGTSPATIFAGRLFEGVAIGAIVGAATAALTELSAPGAARTAALIAAMSNVGGAAIGPVLAGILVQYAPWPSTLVFLVHLALLALLAPLAWRLPETVAHPASFGLALPHLSIPPATAWRFWLAAAAAFCTFANNGLFMALAPSFARDVLHVGNAAVGGAIVFALFAASAAAQYALRQVAPQRSFATGPAVLAAGLAVFLAALRFASLPLLLASAALFGIGNALAFGGGLAVTAALLPKDRKAELISVYYSVAFVGMALPALGVGIAAARFGLFAAAVGFAVLQVVVLAGVQAGLRHLAAQGAAVRTQLQ